MSISSIIQLFETTTCFVISLTIFVLVCGLVLKNVHISTKNLEIDANIKKEKKKRKK